MPAFCCYQKPKHEPKHTNTAISINYNMPSKKVSALARAVKDRVARKPTAKKTATANKPAIEEPVAKKTAARKSAAKKTAAKKAAATDEFDAITADNNPAVAPKRAVKSAGKAPTRRTNANKKRKASGDGGEGESEAPPVKKTKTTKKNAAAAGATAPKKSKSPVNKTAAANKTMADEVAAANADLLAKTMVDIVAKSKAKAKAAGSKRKASNDEDDDEHKDDAPPAKKANTTKKNATTARAKKAKSPVAAKMTTASRAATAKADVVNKAMAGAASKAAGRKRKATADDESSDEAGDDGDAPNAKRVKTSQARSVADEAAPEKAAPKKKAATPKEALNPALKTKIGDKINSAPTQLLDVFVCGEGSAGELGLGSRRLNGKMPTDVKRPRFNPYLSGENPGVVQFACGGMHGIALTKDNRVLTWGVNDNGALGRNTKWTGGLRPASPQRGDQEENANANEDENNEEQEAEANNVEHDEDDSALNPLESTPAEIDMTNVAPGTKFVQVAASDSASFALTEDGRVYSWGTFRVSPLPLSFCTFPKK